MNEDGKGKAPLYPPKVVNKLTIKEINMYNSNYQAIAEVTPELLNTIKNVVSNYYLDEAVHWQDNGEPEIHVFNDLAVLNEFVKQVERSK